ncbi:HU family DNA-binding protein [Aerosakkonemataceae cyanobacterium BLCC-F50]|uniref:HU family DNA-binding protein n=1 Tax=Floridaenema flaviceps BLCC-F50 TaxID=3153642 RepID=A0ABV4XJU0_9CYAN
MNQIEYIQNATGYNAPTITGVLDSFFKFVEVALRQGEEVRLEKFGKFNFKDTPPRTGRNPRTGEEIEIAAKRRPDFKFSKSFIAAVQPEELPLTTAQPEAAKLPPPIPPELLAETVANKSEQQRTWFMSVDGKSIEVNESELISKGVNPNTPLWSLSTGWKLAKDLPELNYLFATAA